MDATLLVRLLEATLSVALYHVNAVSFAHIRRYARCQRAKDLVWIIVINSCSNVAGEYHWPIRRRADSRLSDHWHIVNVS